MKNLYRYALIVVAVALFGVSCVSDGYELDVIDPNAESVGQLEVHFSVQDSELVTRAAQDVRYEHNVQSIYVFVFSGNNRVELSSNDITDLNGNINYFDLDEIEYEYNKTGENDKNPSTGVLKLGAVAGANMRICLIANIGASNSVTRAQMADVISKEVGEFDGIKSYSELQQLVLKLGENTVQRQSAFLLTGEKTGVTLDANENATTAIDIPLYRTDAKISFNVKAANSAYKDFKFVPKKWRVVNVPATTYAIPNASVTAETVIAEGEYLDAMNEKSSGEEVFYFNSTETSFEGKVDDADNSGTFTFYMYENLKGPKKSIGSAGYALREKQVKTTPGADDVVVPGQTYINGEYEYAPELGTYVVFTGQLSYSHEATTENGDKYDEYVMSDAEYCVHLGHNSDTNFDDYKTLRNHHYTYNVTVTGVNDLLVEVEGVDDSGKQEQRPGVEGEVVMSSAKLIEIDGHYDRSLITFTKEEAATIFFAVKTPFERGLDTNGFLNSEADSYVNDYKWIKFLVNSEYCLDNTTYAPFPGEDCYDGGKTKYGTAANSPAYNGTAVVLRDIRQLSNYFADHTPTGNVTVTAFIDEYLYNYDPRNDNNRVTSKDASSTTVTTTYKSIIDESITADELLLWKRSVNNVARMMHIVKKGDMNYSEDGQTSLSRSVVSIQQKPILSLYNHKAVNLKTAWGSESMNETPKMIVSRTTYNNITNTNYYTTAQTLTSGSGNTTWASVISSTDRYGLQGTYNDPSYACALRNRDFNGDGNIDQNEMQWYLAALDQMSGLWIADPIFTEKMFDPQNSDGFYYKSGINVPSTHYVTSTIKDSSPMVYWAEEFGATSKHDDAIKWRQAPVPASFIASSDLPKMTRDLTASQIATVREEAVVSLRCVRNFGAKYTSKVLPQNYYSVTQPSGGDGTIDLTYINAAALRTAPDSGMPLAYGDVNGASENNRPYVGFFVQESGTSVSNWRDAYEKEIDYNSVCPDGYRIPNQREMILMSIAIESWSPESAYIMFNGQYIDVLSQFGSFYYITPGKSAWTPDRVTRMLHSELDDNNIGTNENKWAGSQELSYATEHVRCVKDNPNAKQDASSEFEDEGDNW